MQLGTITGITALTKELGLEREIKDKENKSGEQ
jgi:hypothetical protein